MWIGRAYLNVFCSYFYYKAGCQELFAGRYHAHDGIGGTAAHPCKERKDGAPSFRRRENKIVPGGRLARPPKISMPVTDQFYGMKEFAFEDPDGYTITIAQKAG